MPCLADAMVVTSHIGDADELSGLAAIIIQQYFVHTLGPRVCIHGFVNKDQTSGTLRLA